MLRVALFPADEMGSGHYRMLLPARAAAGTGEIDIEFHPFLPIRRRAVARTVVDIRDLDCDVAVLHRPAERETVDAIPLLQRKGIAVVVEIDDDYAAAHPHSPIFRELHPSHPDRNWHHMRRACHLADLVTVPTPELAARYGGQKARVLPNRVAAGLLQITAPRDGRTVGWGGATSTHPRDLTVTHGGVARAIDETGWRFLTIGPPDGVQRDLGLSHEPDTTGGLPYADYHQALAQLDITIAPLADTQFNRSKSALKMLEAAALGIPCVASIRVEYQRLHREGIGLLASDRARDWYRAVHRLLTEPALRAELAARGREIIAEHHTYEDNGWRWAECWHEAHAIRRAARHAIPA